MDTSETYIKMCEKAEEIQDIYSKDLIVRYTPANAGFLMDSKLDYLYRHKLGDIPIWLPRQDQLQEMVGEYSIELVEHLYRFTSDTAWDDWRAWFQYVQTFTSMEQLWLAFVMKEKYHKIWNGEDWVKES